MSDETFPHDPEAALRRLLEGNARFAVGDPQRPRQGTERRAQVAAGQAPFAAVLTCSDSRVPLEIIFDQGIGDLFVVRVAGNTASDPLVIGSLEFAVEVLGSILVFVLGHSECGAVQAAIDVVTNGQTLPGTIGAVAAPVVPAVEAVQDRPGDELLEAAIEQNVHLAMEALSQAHLLADRVAAGTLLIAGGEYDLATGKVSAVS